MSWTFFSVNLCLYTGGSIYNPAHLRQAFVPPRQTNLSPASVQYNQQQSGNMAMLGKTKYTILCILILDGKIAYSNSISRYLYNHQYQFVKVFPFDISNRRNKWSWTDFIIQFIKLFFNQVRSWLTEALRLTV